MTLIAFCAAPVLTPLPPIHENAVENYTEFGQARVDAPKSLVDTLYVNRAEGKFLMACLSDAKADVADERALRVDAENRAKTAEIWERRYHRQKTLATVAVVGAGVAFVGGVYVGARAASAGSSL